MADPQQMHRRQISRSLERPTRLVELGPTGPVGDDSFEVSARPRRRGTGRARRRRRAGRHIVGGQPPSPKCAASDRPLVMTEIASAVDSVPLGHLQLAVLGDAGAQLAEHGDDAPDLFGGGRHRRQRRAAQFVDAPGTIAISSSAVRAPAGRRC